ncbi:MAG: carboxypeptidase regulatory-like domain-containing protein [Planctomycetes bacterium]|nr:carboxypeptidase regulatory-like domain-containing protein [Planctomycetota bacterium]
MKFGPQREWMILLVPGLFLALGMLAFFGRTAERPSFSSAPSFSRYVTADDGPLRRGPATFVRNEGSITLFDAGTSPKDAIDAVGLPALLPDQYRIRLLDDSGLPVSQAQVVIHRRLSQTVSSANAIDDVLRTTAEATTGTEADGTLSFRGDAQGLYELDVDIEGYARKRYRLRDPGHRVLRLVRPAIVAGRVYDQDGRPAEGVTVEIFHDDRLNESTLTDTTGYYEFPRVTPEIATLQVRSAGFIRSRDEHVRVEAGMRTIRDFDLDRGGVLQVQVLDQDDQAVSDTQVELVEARSGKLVARDQTDAAGQVSMSCLVPNWHYLVVAHHPVAGDQRHEFSTAADVLQTGHSETLALMATWSLSGTVRTAQGIPVAGAQVIAQARVDYGISAIGHSAQAVSGIQGDFVVSGLQAGSTYDLLVFHPQFGLRPISRVARESGMAATLAVELPEPGVAEGYVYDAAGERVPGALVWLHLDEAGLPDSGTVTPEDLGNFGTTFVVRANEEGWFSMSNLPWGAKVEIEFQDAFGRPLLQDRGQRITKPSPVDPYLDARPSDATTNESGSPKSVPGAAATPPTDPQPANSDPVTLRPVGHLQTK